MKPTRRPSPRAALAPLALALGCGGAAPHGAQPVRADPTVTAAAPATSSVDTTTPVPPVRDPRERVVYWRAGSLWLMHADGTLPAPLISAAPGAPDDHPALSPRGDAVAYAALDQEGIYRLHVLTLADHATHVLTDGGGIGDGQPAWSPGGRRIAFLRGDPRDQLDLYLVDVPPDLGASTTTPTPRLLLGGDDDAPERVGHPVFTSDGAAIVLSADRRAGAGTALYRLDIATRALRRLTPIPRTGADRTLDLDATLSPDGARIAFASNRHAVAGAAAGDDLDLYAIALDGSGLTRLTAAPGSSREPAYSPDGQRLFFASTRADPHARAWDIYVMAAGGGRALRLTHDEHPHNRAPSTGLAK